MDIYLHFDQSVKRRETLAEFKVFTDVEYMKVLKHCSTRWLSLLRIVCAHQIASIGDILHQS